MKPMLTNILIPLYKSVSQNGTCLFFRQKDNSMPSNRGRCVNLPLKSQKCKMKNMLRYHLCSIFLVLLSSGCIGEISVTDNSNSVKLLPPPEGVYHRAFPDFGGTGNNMTSERIVEFENLVGKPITHTHTSKL